MLVIDWELEASAVSALVKMLTMPQPSAVAVELELPEEEVEVESPPGTEPAEALRDYQYECRKTDDGHHK